MAEILDFKKEYKQLYLPKNTPTLIEIPEMNFVSITGKGDPNDENGDYQKAIGLLYAISYTIKMSKKGQEIPDGYFDYVVPPLEGLWWTEKSDDLQSKSNYNWISMIRLPEFVDEKVFDWACKEVAKKKKIETDKAVFFPFKEGLCVQCMHIGSYDDEPKTFEQMNEFLDENHLIKDLNVLWNHHEIYLSDPRKGDISKLKTVLRIPVKNQ
ncbi:MAG: GyrI-like domain-containing protein [Prevotellaceae bacterium]|jgi:hypothetical protein|nr:GyrI-like domain-containing protein [Prevotellaceae bacterium]